MGFADSMDLFRRVVAVCLKPLPSQPRPKPCQLLLQYLSASVSRMRQPVVELMCLSVFQDYSAGMKPIGPVGIPQPLSWIRQSWVN